MPSTYFCYKYEIKLNVDNNFLATNLFISLQASRKKLRGKSYKHSASFDPARMGEEFGDDLSASYGYAVNK